MTADPISGIPYPILTGTADITTIMQPPIDSIGAKIGDLKTRATLICVGSSTSSLGSSGAVGTVSWPSMSGAGAATMWSAGNPSRIVAPYAGTMTISATVAWGTSNTGDRVVGVLFGGTLYPLASGAITYTGSFGPTTSGTASFVMTAGQYVEIQVGQTSGATMTPTFRVSARLDS